METCDCFHGQFGHQFTKNDSEINEKIPVVEFKRTCEAKLLHPSNL